MSTLLTLSNLTAATPSSAAAPPDGYPRVGPYSVRQIIGAGSYSEVKFVVDTRNGQPRAMKCMDRRAIRRDAMESSVESEVNAMKMLCHENVVQMKEVIQTGKSVLLVMELFTGGELFDRVVASTKLAEPVARGYLQQLVLGLLHCHTRGIAHRDLKPENLLLDKRDVLKISDFGLCTITSATATAECRVQGVWGTPNYMAPEVTYGDGVWYNPFVADIWSVGVILYVMVVGHLPFNSDSTRGIYARIRTCDLRESSMVHLSRFLVDLIKRMLEVDPDKRITLHEICQNPWFAVQLDGTKVDQAISAAPSASISQPSLGLVPSTSTSGSGPVINHAQAAAAATAAGSPKSSLETKLNAFDIITPYIIGALAPVVSANPSSSVIRVSTRFIADATMDELLSRTKRALSVLHVEYKMMGSHVIKGFLRKGASHSNNNNNNNNNGGMIAILMTLFSTVSPKLSLMEVRRVRGDASDYFHLYYLFAVQIRDIIPHLPHDPTATV
eukprot:PhM_4_TR17469/c2_g1_i1/m.85708